MPAFKYQAKQQVPGVGGHKQAQARGLRAPQLRAPQLVLMGNTRQKQFVPERQNQGVLAMTQSVQKLGNLFLAKSLRQADEQSTLEASEAISKYRRSVSDTYYNEQDGLFSRRGAEGSTVFRDNQENIGGIRDSFSEGLSDSAKRKYLVKVAGHHNDNLDRLAKKQFNNVNQYRQETRAATEGDDAEGIFASLKEGNISSVLSILSDTPEGLTEAEKQARQDRLILSTIDSADAQNISAEDMGKLIGSVKHLSSQNIHNALLEGLDVYKNAERVGIKKAESDAKEAMKEDQDKNFTSVLEAVIDRKNINPKDILQLNLAKADTKYLLNAIEKNATTSDRNAYDPLFVSASDGILPVEKLKQAVSHGDITAKDYVDLIKTNDEEIKRLTFPEKENGDVRDAYNLLKSYIKDKDLSPVEASRWKRDLKGYIKDNPGKDPAVWLEQRIKPIKQGTVARFVSGLFGGENKTIRNDGMVKYQQFTPIQQEYYEKIKEEMKAQNKGNIDDLPESQVEQLVNRLVGQDEFTK